MNISIEQLIKEVEILKSQGKIIVSTCGCFDQLHHGHFDYLKKSKSLGDILIVLVNSDSSVRAIKNVGKPLNSEKIRAMDVAEIKSVDYTVIFDDTEPSKYLNLIKPDIHTKGQDYTMLPIHEKETVEKNGGRVELIEFSKYSTTIEKVKFFTED